MHKLTVLWILLAPLFIAAQTDAAKRITQKLCSPEFHGRGYVNGGDSIAAEYIATEFRRIGLKCFNKTFFQSFTFSVNTFPSDMSVSIGDRTLIPGVHFLADPASAGYQGVLNPMRIDAETAFNQEQLQQVLISIIREEKFNAVALDFAHLSSDSLKKLNGLSHQLAGLLPVLEITSQKLTWSVSGEQLKFPLLQVQDSVFKFNEPVRIHIKSVLKSNHTSKNVIGFLPAQRKSKTTLVFSAHYDHLGRMGSETYFPGANDNASGTAMLISLAEHFKQHPQPFNILFIAFAGEEAGLLGSKYFVSHPVIKLKNIRFLVNLDIMGSGEEGITVVNATLHEHEFMELQRINSEQNLLTQVKKRGPAANSDHYWFTQFGVPAFFIYTMGPNKNYHDIFDSYENLSFQEFNDLHKLLVGFVEQSVY